MERRTPVFVNMLRRRTLYPLSTIIYLIDSWRNGRHQRCFQKKREKVVGERMGANLGRDTKGMKAKLIAAREGWKIKTSLRKFSKPSLKERS